MKKIKPELGDVEAALEKDLAIDPPVGDYEAALESMRSDPELGDVNACVCFDKDGNPLNECDNASNEFDGMDFRLKKLIKLIEQ